MRRPFVIFSWFVLFSGANHPSCAAAQAGTAMPVIVVTQDPSGAPVKNELVIVQDLNHQENEMIRVLTNDDGEIAPVNLSPGLYRVIATAPYTLWQTRIQEFLVNGTPVRLVVKLELMPSRGYGDIIPIGERQVRLRVLTSDGHPVADANVLTRDEEATTYLEGWYRTNQSGEVTIETAAKPLVIVVVFGKTLVRHEFNTKSSHAVVRLP